MAEARHDGSSKGWGWLRQVQSTTQQLGQMCTEGVGEAKRRLEENRPGIDQFVKNLGDNVQQGVKKVQEQQPGFDQLVRNIGDNVQKGVRNIQENLARDPWSSPPTAAEMASLDLVYVNDRIIAMKLPVDKRPPEPASAASASGGSAAGGGSRAKERGTAGLIRPQDGNDIDVVAALLRSRHAGHYMVWNVSEEGYDYSMFEDQVLEFRFPGHPAPPLGMLFKICSSIESWISADDKNVAAVHCLTGRGRTSTVLACYLAWVGEFSTPNEALQQVAVSKGVPMERLTIPSQRRYVSYFASIMEGVRPRSEPLLLRRVIVNTIPTFGTKGGSIIGPGKGAAAAAEEEAVAAGGEGENGALGCCPYLQVFKGGTLIFTASYRPSERLAYTAGSGEGEGDGHGEEQMAATASDELPWAYTSDDSIAFSLDCILQGDLLIRCRHLSPDGRRVSMFRAAFHTGYVPSGVLRLTKQQLDGACADDRFHQDFFLDLIFAPVEKPTSTPTAASTGDVAENAPRANSADNSEAVATPPGSTAAKDNDKGDAIGGEEKGNDATEGEQAEQQAVGERGDGAAEGEGKGGVPPESENSAVARREGGLVVDTEAAEAFDSMLHRDAGFWEEIASRKERRAAIVKERQAARARGAVNAAAAARAKASKQKEDAAAATVRAGGIRFSIDEEEVAQSGRSQWSDAASSSSPPPTAPALSSKTGGIDDDDLLAQLAEAEMEQGPLTALDASSPLVKPAPGDNSPSVTSSGDGLGVGEAFGAVGDGRVVGSASVGGADVVLPTAAGGGEGRDGGGKEQSSQRKSVVDKEVEVDSAPLVGQKGAASNASMLEGAKRAVGGGAKVAGKGGDIPGKSTSKPTAATAAGSSLDDELSQLEELERELGIGGVSGGVGGAGGADGVGAGSVAGGEKASPLADAEKDDSFDMENLDELEGYLESLAK